MAEQPTPRGYCAVCRSEVDIDGQQGDAEGTVWSHLVMDVETIVVPGHAEGCWGDCEKHGCPVPTPEQAEYVRECGPVHVRQEA